MTTTRGKETLRYNIPIPDSLQEPGFFFLSRDHLCLLRNEAGLSSMQGKVSLFYSITWLKGFPLEHDKLRFAKLRLLITDALYRKKIGFSDFEAIVTNNDILRQHE